ncbi:MAG TPA: UDP-N-acetylmuramoyl-L-alanine--D-glutamate ligase, partial [Spirochaetales bacterium]|nr:UDP-N-acetylmuramoyl-L-alanine--D-glutamate ligase [Spirochaetales bacterium]
GQWSEDRPGASLLPDGSCQAVLPGLGRIELFPAQLTMPGEHNRRNLMAAGLAAWAAGADPQRLGKALAEFPGVEHRLEVFLKRNDVRWVNDSAATVPEAVAAALGSFTGHISLITGGTDKNLDYKPLRSAYKRANTIVLLAGSGTDKLIPILKEDGIGYLGPCSSIEEAIALAAQHSPPGATIMLSPGATSFGMFKNEFDRGLRFKAAVRSYYGTAPY